MIPSLFVFRKYNIPSDISYTIYNYIIHSSAQKIIDKWFSFILIHNTNLCTLINKLNYYQTSDYYGNNYFYYDLCDNNVFITFSICLKYIVPTISTKTWWLEKFSYGFNGLGNVNNMTAKNITIYYHLFLKLEKLFD
jgi:hypothetical protein|tara:strand:- start:122 stop:532 length:411 start_codon:yes stop_codon:yes gene_type:complete